MARKRETEHTAALMTAKGVIERLPEGCVFGLEISNDNSREDPAELEVFPQDNEQYYAVTRPLQHMPEKPDEWQFQHGILRVVVYPPDAWLEK